ncbi:MAG TPA: hypothetical protein VLR88_00850 [Propionibacteriaceae bacterium]|nr:hypothetical protein [Propionibacteriaceae bacterium]
MDILASFGVLLGGLGWLLAQTFGENTVWRRLATLGALAAVGLRIVASETYADQTGEAQLTFLFPIVFGLGAFSVGAAVSASGVLGEVRLPTTLQLVLDPASRMPPTTNRLWLIGEIVSSAAVVVAFGWARPLASFVWGTPEPFGTEPTPALVVVAVSGVLALLVPRWSPHGWRAGDVGSDVRWVVRRVASVLRRRVAVVGAPVAWLVWKPLPDPAGTMLAVLLVACLGVLVTWPTVRRVTRVSGQVAGEGASGSVLAHLDEPWQAWETYHPDREERDRQHKPRL